ncbi:MULTISPECIES: hypothetical protein [Haloarcula]|uniref:hypothetical protein n=1 Tax=Haloarcula TaxID=2237 RepID=UPI0023EC62F8|nr:hypothetical protein [Halomicroarcula sp. XH51]
MVGDRVTDGRRIGQLLASELTGLKRGPLADVRVVDADPDVEPTADGAFAYAVEYRDERVGTVHVTPATARLTIAAAPSLAVEREDVTVESTARGTVLVAHSGAAVKRLVDELAAVLES